MSTPVHPVATPLPTTAPRKYAGPNSLETTLRKLADLPQK